MEDDAAANLTLVRRFVEAVAARRRDDAFALLAEDVVQDEHPNRFAPRGAHRDLAGMRAAAEAGARLMASETYDVIDAIASGDRVAIAVAWTGTLAAAAGPLPAGHVLRAHIAQFFTVRGGRITAIRNYDCFEP